MKTIVTHIGPDLDAICAIWQIKTFFPDWTEATIAFVPAGQTLKGMAADSDPEVWHVDTGFGLFDHHQSDEDTCASKKLYGKIKQTQGTNTTLERLVEVVNDIDHFRESSFPNPTADFWDFGLIAQIDGWRLIYADNPLKIVELTMQSLDGIYKTLQNKVWAEKELKEKGQEFKTRWGKGIAVETPNDEIIHLGQKMGYVMVVRKDPGKGYLRIKALPEKPVDLTPLYERLKKEEPGATWFLHASLHILLNGSTHDPNMKPTQKTLPEIVKALEEVYH